jgi:hypothetical protein
LRVNHYIKPNADSQFPHDIIVVDTEARIEDTAKGQNQSFRLGYAVCLGWNDKTSSWDECEYPLKSINSWYDLLDNAITPKNHVLVFAHNAAYDYALLSMDTYLSSRGFTVDAHILDSAFIVRSHKVYNWRNTNFTFASTTNFYQLSLEKLGEIFGDCKLAKPDFRSVSDSNLMAYCKQDTKALVNLVKQHISFVKTNDLGNFKLTIAGQAFGAFRHRFMSEKILVHTYPDILDLEMQSYRGGRCEVFKMGKHRNIYKLDINSMYPYVMKSFDYPVRLLSNGLVKESFPEDILCSGVHVLANCNLTLREPAIAIKRDKLLFPIGKITQTLTDPEIHYLLEHPEVGHIDSVNHWVSYEKASLFRQYVDYFYSIKQNAENEAQKTMAKMFLNSLYGKFAQHSFEKLDLVTNTNTLSRIHEDMNDADTNTMDYMTKDDTQRFKRLGKDIYRIYESTDVLAYDSCPIIASTVTAYARCYLFDIMRKAGLENVLYCDTDSVFLTKDGYESIRSLVSPTELGKLKVEEIGDCEIFGAKNYTFNGDIKLKGVKKDAIKIAPNTYEQSQFITKNLRYSRGMTDGIVEVRQVKRHISNNYDKGIVHKDGTVSPLVFADW